MGLPVAQAAALCKVTPAAVRKWIARGHIARGRAGLIDPTQLLQWWDHDRKHAMARGGCEP